MVNHVDIIKAARQKDANLFSMNQRSDVFIFQMKMLNVLLLEKIPGFTMGTVFFPSSDQLVERLCEAYVNEGKISDIEAALKQASKDKETISATIKSLLG